MPIYEFKCQVCESICELTCSVSEYTRLMSAEDTIELHCPDCGSPCIHRVFSFSIKPMMPEHFNSSTGQFVSSERQLKDQMKVQSEQATLRTGIEHNFVPVDPQDKEKLGVTSAGLDATYNRRKKLNMPISDAMRPENNG